MSQTPLKTVVLGLNEHGRMLLECAAQSGLFKIEAVVDKDAELAKKVAAEYGCRHYDDYRLAVTQGGLEVVAAAAPLHACAEYIHTALSKELHVLRIAPPARTFAELAEFVHHAADKGVQFAVASGLRFHKAFAAMREYLQQNRDENIFLVTALCGTGQSQEPWRRDPKLAGGGILLYNCYEMIDQIIQSFGTPDEVYAINTSQAPDRKQRLSVTEDTAVVTMKFADTLTINLIASKAIKPDVRVLIAHGQGRDVCIDGGKFSVTDSENNLAQEVNESATAQELLSLSLADFEQSIVSPEKIRPLPDGSNYLAAMALIESAYLSARTGVPESPHRILQLSQKTMDRHLFK